MDNINTEELAGSLIVGYVREVIRQTETSLLVEHPDVPEELREEVAALIDAATVEMEVSWDE